MPDWDEILRRDGPPAWRTAYRLLGRRADADECFQDACLDALGIARRGPVLHWRALLQRLAAARAVDRLRRRARQGERPPADGWDALASPDAGPEQDAELAELSGRLRDALARIPARQAEAFTLHALEGWTHAEIARELNTSADAVGVLVHRARRRLRVLLEAPPAARPAPSIDGPAPREEATS